VFGHVSKWVVSYLLGVCLLKFSSAITRANLSLYDFVWALIIRAPYVSRAEVCGFPKLVRLV
jgi:hypothetical protein